MKYYIIIAIIILLEFAFGYFFDMNGWSITTAFGLIIFSPLIIIALKVLFANKKKS